MKKILTATLFLFFLGFVVRAQHSSPQGDRDFLFNLATAQYNEGEFSGCFRSVSTWIEESGSDVHLEEAYFMQAVSAYELNKRETSVLLIDFIKKYPVSPFTEKAFYLLGCSAMNAGQFKDALEFFKRSPELSLSKKDKLDYNFRYAYVSMQLGDFQTARKIFTELAGGESRYAASSSYFNTYIDYAGGNSSEAAKGFSKFDGNEQFGAVVPYFNAQLLYSEGKLDKSIELAKSLLSGSPDPVQKAELLRLLGAACYDNNDYDASRTYYREYLSLNPQIINSDKYRIGVLNYIAGEYDRAITRLSDVANLDNVTGQSAAFHLGLVYLRKKQTTDAVTWFEKAADQTFDRGIKEKSSYNYAVVLNDIAESSFENKILAFTKFITEFPESDKVNAIKGFLADTYYNSGEYVKSLSVYESISNPDEKTLKARSLVLLMISIVEIDNKNFETAVRYLDESIKLSNSIKYSNSEALFWRSEANYQLKNFTSAASDLKKYMADANTTKLRSYPSALYNLGYINFNQKNYTESQKSFDKFIKLNGIKEDVRYADALNRMGDCSFATKNYDKAEKFYQDADKVSGQGNDYAVYQKAYTMGLRKMHQEKYNMLSQFDNKFPGSSYADDALFEAAKACMAMKKNDLAIKTFSQLLDRYPQSTLAAKAGIQIGLLYYNLGNSDKAAAAYKKVIENYPGTDESKMALSDLKMIHVTNNTVSEYIDYTSNLSTPVNIEISEQDSLAWLAAENLLMEGNNEKAKNAFESYLNKYPDGRFVIDCNYHLGKLNLGSGKTELAKSYLEKVALNNGNRFQNEALDNLSEIFYEEKDYQSALKYFALLKDKAKDQAEKSGALAGMIRCNYQLKNDNQVIENATALILDKNSDKEILKEILYYRAKSYLNKKQDALAKTDLQKTAVEFSSAIGAESKYLLADLIFRQGSSSESEKMVQDFIQAGTPHSYWLARGFILLSDINIKKKDKFQAKQYLLSLKENYHGDDDIAEMIESRLSVIDK